MTRLKTARREAIFKCGKIFESAKNEPPPRGSGEERAKFWQQESQDWLESRLTRIPRPIIGQLWI